MKKIVFSALSLLAFSAVSSAHTILDEGDSLKSVTNIEKSIKTAVVEEKFDGVTWCNIEITLVDENNVGYATARYQIPNVQTYMECLQRGIDEARKLNEQGIKTDKVFVLGVG